MTELKNRQVQTRGNALDSQFYKVAARRSKSAARPGMHMQQCFIRWGGGGTCTPSEEGILMWQTPTARENYFHQVRVG